MPKSKSEKLKQERRQIRRSFTKIHSEASTLFSVPRLQEEEICSLKSSFKAIKAKQLESIAFEKEPRSISFEELEDEAELDEFCDEAEVFAMEIEGKIDKI